MAHAGIIVRVHRAVVRVDALVGRRLVRGEKGCRAHRRPRRRRTRSISSEVKSSSLGRRTKKDSCCSHRSHRCTGPPCRRPCRRTCRRRERARGRGRGTGEGTGAARTNGNTCRRSLRRVLAARDLLAAARYAHTVGAGAGTAVGAGDIVGLSDGARGNVGPNDADGAADGAFAGCAVRSTCRTYSGSPRRSSRTGSCTRTDVGAGEGRGAVGAAPAPRRPRRRRRHGRLPGNAAGSGAARPTARRRRGRGGALGAGDVLGGGVP